MTATEAEADREDRAGAGLAQLVDRRADVGLDLLGCRLWDVLAPGELVAALGDPRRAPEVVDRERGEPALGKPQRELLVEAVEAADVRENDDADPARLVGQGRERRELIPVSGFEDEILVRD